MRNAVLWTGIAIVSAAALVGKLGAQTTGAALPKAPLPPATQPPRVYDAAELDRIVSPIALYPDPLLAQVFSAAMYPREIPAAAQYASSRKNLNGEQLADALANDQVPWNPAVQALVPFPTVLEMMASAMPWTEEIGDAFQLQRADVMDAVQRMRAQAQKYGYLESNDQLTVSRAPYIEIVPVNPSYVVVPYYDPYVVFYAPRPRVVVSTAIFFGHGVRLGVWYDPWGWRNTGFAWNTHYVVGSYPGWNRPRGWRPVYYANFYERNRNWDRGRDNDGRGRDNDGRGRDNDGRAYPRGNAPGSNGTVGPDGYRRTGGNGNGNGNGAGNGNRPPRDDQRDGPRDRQPNPPSTSYRFADVTQAPDTRRAEPRNVPVQLSQPAERGSRNAGRTDQPRTEQPRNEQPRAARPQAQVQSAPPAQRSGGGNGGGQSAPRGDGGGRSAKSRGEGGSHRR